MKKTFYFSSVALISIFMLSCNQTGKRSETGEAQNVTVTEGDKSFTVDSTNSNIEWIGSKPTGQHTGTIQVKQGELKVTDGMVVGGNFTIDMKTIKDVDLTNPEDNAKLVGHLKSADFFDVEKFPTSKFVITGVEPLAGNTKFNSNVTGNLTMKDSTVSITFPAMISISDKIAIVNSEPFVIDRSMWNVRYGSRKFFDDLRDNYISDDISLKVTINANED